MQRNEVEILFDHKSACRWSLQINTADTRSHEHIPHSLLCHKMKSRYLHKDTFGNVQSKETHGERAFSKNKELILVLIDINIDSIPSLPHSPSNSILSLGRLVIANFIQKLLQHRQRPLRLRGRHHMTRCPHRDEMQRVEVHVIFIVIDRVVSAQLIAVIPPRQPINIRIASVSIPVVQPILSSTLSAYAVIVT